MNLEEIKNYNIFKSELLNIELLKTQGINNISYLLKTTDKEYVLRVFKSKKSVNISREFEFLTQKKAYEKGFATKPIFLNKDFMIYIYEKGIHKYKLSNLEIKNLSKIVKKMHKIDLKSKNYNFAKDLKYYSSILKDEKSSKLLKKTQKALKTLKKYKKDLVLTHHDLNPKNIIFTQDEKILIIDWEYAGTNDRFFDLATICVEFKFTKGEEKIFLNNYFKKIKKSYLKKLKEYKKIYKNICALWFSSLENKTKI